MLLKKIISGLMCSAVALAVVPFSNGYTYAAEINENALTFFVSPNGDDENDGSIDAPFKSFERAVEAVDEINDNMMQDIYVYFRGGKYNITETINLAAKDSGSNGYRVVYTAYPNETPIFSAGVEITGWEQHDGNIYKAHLDRDEKLRTLYVDGERAYMAEQGVRSSGGVDLVTIEAGSEEWAWETEDAYKGMRYPASNFPEIKSNPEDVEIEYATTWNTLIACADTITTDSDTGERIVYLQWPGFAFMQGGKYSTFSVVGGQTARNAYEFLDAEGEFYFDKSEKTIYYYKRWNDDMSSVKAYAPNGLETFINIQGNSLTDRVHDVELNGFTFEYSDWNLYEAYGSHYKGSVQASTCTTALAERKQGNFRYGNVDTLPGMVMLNSCENVAVKRNTFTHSGSEGLSIINDVTNSEFAGNIFEDIAGSSIVVSHPQHIVIGDGSEVAPSKYTPDVEGACINVNVNNNFINNSGRLFKGHPAVIAFYVAEFNFSHNVVKNSPYDSISMGWGWEFDTEVLRDNKVSKNMLIDSMQKLNDGGAIYTLYAQPGTVISGNYLKGIPSGVKKYGLHQDEGSAYMTLKENVIEKGIASGNAVHVGVWGDQHDITYADNYGTRGDYFQDIPGGVFGEIDTYPDAVWPIDAYEICVQSGISEEYRDIIPRNVISDADIVLPASVCIEPDERKTQIPVVSLCDGSKTIWLAPDNTTEFEENESMTSASGDASSISLPEARGVYKLYVTDDLGNIISKSKSIVDTNGRWTYVDNTSEEITYNSTWAVSNDLADFGESESCSSKPNAYAELIFDGCAIEVLAPKQKNMGKCDIYIDNILVAEGIDCYQSNTTKQAVIFSKRDLEKGVHTIKVVNTGEKNPSSSDTMCAIDAFRYYSKDYNTTGVSAVTADGSTLHIDLANLYEPVELLIASYDSQGVLTGLKTVTTMEDTTVENIDTSGYVKVFTWDSFEKLVPTDEYKLPKLLHNVVFNITDSEGEKASKALVTISGREESGVEIDELTIQADENGAAQKQLYNGEYKCLISAPGCVPRNDVVFTVKDGDVQIDTVLEKSNAPVYDISINAETLSGESLSNYDVELRDKIYDLVIHPTSENMYRISDGEYTYKVTKSGYLTQSGEFTVAGESKTVEIPMPMIYTSENFEAVTDNWGMVSSGKGAAISISDNALNISLDSNKGASTATKEFDTTISSLKKAVVEFDWKPTVDYTTNKGRYSFLYLLDNNNNKLFGLYEIGSDKECYITDGETKTPFGLKKSIWYHVLLKTDFTNGKCSITITDDMGEILVDNAEFTTNAQNLSKLSAETGYSLAPMMLDNFMLYETK